MTSLTESIWASTLPCLFKSGIDNRCMAYAQAEGKLLGQLWGRDRSLALTLLMLEQRYFKMVLCLIAPR